MEEITAPTLRDVYLSLKKGFDWITSIVYFTHQYYRELSGIPVIWEYTGPMEMPDKETISGTTNSDSLAILTNGFIKFENIFEIYNTSDIFNTLLKFIISARRKNGGFCPYDDQFGLREVATVDATWDALMSLIEVYTNYKTISEEVGPGLVTKQEIAELIIGGIRYIFNQELNNMGWNISKDIKPDGEKNGYSTGKVLAVFAIISITNEDLPDDDTLRIQWGRMRNRCRNRLDSYYNPLKDSILDNIGKPPKDNDDLYKKLLEFNALYFIHLVVQNDVRHHETTKILQNAAEYLGKNWKIGYDNLVYYDFSDCKPEQIERGRCDNWCYRFDVQITDYMLKLYNKGISELSDTIWNKIDKTITSIVGSQNEKGYWKDYREEEPKSQNASFMLATFQSIQVLIAYCESVERILKRR